MKVELTNEERAERHLLLAEIEERREYDPDDDSLNDDIRAFGDQVYRRLQKEYNGVELPGCIADWIIRWGKISIADNAFNAFTAYSSDAIISYESPLPIYEHDPEAEKRYMKEIKESRRRRTMSL